MSSSDAGPRQVAYALVYASDLFCKTAALRQDAG
jgi:hypothetical protein